MAGIANRRHTALYKPKNAWPTAKNPLYSSWASNELSIGDGCGG
jgi:hypothetical protein